MNRSYVYWEPLRTKASSAVSGTYSTIGTPLVYPAFILKIYNGSTEDVIVSVDGTTDMDVVPTSSSVIYKIDNESGLESISMGTQFYLKGTTGTGNIYITSIYIVPR